MLDRVLTKADTAQRRLRRQLRRWGSPAPSPTPVFVVGCQRSGTSMVLRTFDLSLDATVYWESDRRAFVDHLLHDDRQVQALVRGSRTRSVVFKAMHQLQESIRYLELLPRLRIVWMYRGNLDVVNSSVRRFGSMRESLRKIVEEPKESGWWGAGLSDRQRAVIHEHYRPEMSLESAYALFWHLRNSFFFELGLDSHPRVRLFRYEQVVRQPDMAFSDMFEFCDCPFEPSFTREIFATSIGKDPRPALDGRIEGLCAELAERIERTIA